MKLQNKIALLFALGIALPFASCSDHNDVNDHDNNDTTIVGTNGHDNPAVNDRDEDFIEDAIEANAKEMAWLKQGIDLGTDAELKTHAQHMMTDHEQMDKDLKAYATKKNISLADVDMDSYDRINLDEKKGPDWDEEWADEIVDMHEKTIKKFERNQDKVADAELKDMITKALPTLRSHLEMATKLEDKLDKKD